MAISRGFSGLSLIFGHGQTLQLLQVGPAFGERETEEAKDVPLFPSQNQCGTNLDAVALTSILFSNKSVLNANIKDDKAATTSTKAHNLSRRDLKGRTTHNLYNRQIYFSKYSTVLTMKVDSGLTRIVTILYI